MDKIKIAELRRQYGIGSLDKKDLDSDPINQFQTWFAQANEMEVVEPNAMTLSTADENGHPAARIVLLKGVDQRGFIFFSNYNSHKGQQMLKHPFAALTFLWLKMERQVNIQGRVIKLDEEASTRYFQSRPKGSQIGAWASPQSQIIENRDILEDNLSKLTKKFEGQKVLPKPADWGGYLLQPDVIEFWQGRASRLHDRFVYRRGSEEGWSIDRLAP